MNKPVSGESLQKGAALDDYVPGTTCCSGLLPVFLENRNDSPLFSRLFFGKDGMADVSFLFGKKQECR